LTLTEGHISKTHAQIICMLWRQSLGF
jgi:hypothetical protein